MKGFSIFGANSLTRLLIEFIREEDGLVDGVVVDDEYWTCPDFHGVPLRKYSAVPPGTKMVSAVGYRNMRARRRVFDRIVLDGHVATNWVSSRADVSRSASLGCGNILMPGVQIEPLARLGSNNLLWSRTLVCHEVAVGDHNYISAACVIGGHGRVGNLCFIGNSASTIDGVHLADETQLLPGSVLMENTEPHTKYFGCPARAIGMHAETGIVIQR